MIPFADALKSITDIAPLRRTEDVSVAHAVGRIAAQDYAALKTHPPFAASAMDGYAARSEDSRLGNTLFVIGEVPAGSVFDGKVGPGQVVRLFTGSPIPEGANHVIIQEDVERTGDTIKIIDVQNPPRHIRRAGIDFETRDLLVRKGERINAVQGSLLAGGGHAAISVTTKPRVAIFSNGDELAEIGETDPHRITSSTPVALAQWLRDWGAEADYLGIARDNLDSLSNTIQTAADYDVIIPLGGASVGDYDLVRRAFLDAGLSMTFSKVAVKPGKPTWHGNLGRSYVLGLPGNPASGLVCAWLFARPLIRALSGQTSGVPLPMQKAVLVNSLPSNGPRETFSRAHVKVDPQGQLRVTPFPRQDSSLLTPFARANALIYQFVNTAAIEAGELVDIVLISNCDPF